MQSFYPPDNDKTQDPDNCHRQYIISPLNAQTRNTKREKSQHPGNTKIGRVPDVRIPETQNVFRHN